MNLQHLGTYDSRIIIYHSIQKRVNLDPHTRASMINLDTHATAHSPTLCCQHYSGFDLFCQVFI